MSLEPIKQTCCSSLKDNSCTKENKNEPCGARFGTAIAAVKDLNVDGFNDVVIGAPLEDDHAGAVYIHHGSDKTIRKDYAQVRHEVPLGSHSSLPRGLIRLLHSSYLTLLLYSDSLGKLGTIFSCVLS